MDGFRQNLERLANTLSSYEARVTIPQILHKCPGIEEFSLGFARELLILKVHTPILCFFSAISALLVPLGGTLFEDCAKVFCTEDCVQKLLRVHGQEDDGADRVMTTEEFYRAFEPTTRNF